MQSTTRDDGKGGSEAAGSATNRRSSSSSPESSVIPSFTSDSPYLQSYIDREMHDLHVLTETLRDISARARTFGKCGALMAEATRRLSGACRLNPVSSGNNNGSSSSSDNNNNGTSKDDTANSNDHLAAIMTERRQSIGDEMVSVLSVLGEISCRCTIKFMSKSRGIIIIIVGGICRRGTERSQSSTDRGGSYE
jgi:hypothetical protein